MNALMVNLNYNLLLQDFYVSLRAKPAVTRDTLVPAYSEGSKEHFLSLENRPPLIDGCD